MTELHEARLYAPSGEGRVRCALCAHRCTIAPGRRGICGVRENQDGTLYSLVYGKLVSSAVDPIEKKPLFHFHPGSTALSIATVGCNFSCVFCQNADISQASRRDGPIIGQFVPPEDTVAAAQSRGCRSIAYTYTEPTVFFEYAYDVAKLAQPAGIANVFVSNGYMTPECVDLLAPDGQQPLLDAANIDIKAFRNAFYREQCGASLQPVLDLLVLLSQRGVWLEVTTLVIPGLNDSAEELADIARFVCDELGPETPWHVSRFHPTYRLTDRGPTATETVRLAREIGLGEGLRHVYVGNIWDGRGEDTLCPDCGATVIRRQGYRILSNALRNGACPHCGRHIAGVGL